MRILAGDLRSRVFKAPEGNGTRPTDSRTRETMFNMIGERIVGARVLDLYAGSGSLGLESLSRGAVSCLFVEQNPTASRIIRENITAFGLDERAMAWQASVKGALGRLVEKVGKESSVAAVADDDSAPKIADFYSGFDMIFADPPFHRAGELPELCRLLDKAAPLLHNGREPFSRSSLLVIQHHWKSEPSLSPVFRRINERRMSESKMSFYEVEPTSH